MCGITSLGSNNLQFFHPQALTESMFRFFYIIIEVLSCKTSMSFQVLTGTDLQLKRKYCSLGKWMVIL